MIKRHIVNKNVSLYNVCKLTVLLFLGVLAMETMLIGNKYYERVAQPIISMERWEQHLILIKDSIINRLFPSVQYL